MLKDKNNLNSINSIHSVNSISGGKLFAGKNVNNNNNKNCARMNANNRGKNANIAKNTNHNNNNQNNRNISGNGASKIQKYSAGSAEPRNRVQKINNLQAAMDAKDTKMQRWPFKSCNTAGAGCNDTRMQHIIDKQQRKPPTPARKRSSLARPVRVHDSFPQENGPVIIDWNETQNLQNQEIQQMHQPRLRQPQQKVKKKQREKEERKKKRERLEQAIDDLVEIRVDEEVTTWPIRLRLGEFFELSLPKCRRRKRRRRHRMMIATMREKTMKTMMEAGGIRAGRQQDHGAFRDTERLLKVLSINNVDQDNRYNVARCSVM